MVLAAEAEGHEQMDYAIDQGINFFDTSDAYGDGHAESVLGEFLAGVPRNEVIVTTKVFNHYNPDASRYPDLAPAHIVERCEASLKRLGVETIDLYLLHRDDPDYPVARQNPHRTKHHNIKPQHKEKIHLRINLREGFEGEYRIRRAFSLAFKVGYVKMRHTGNGLPDHAVAHLKGRKVRAVFVWGVPGGDEEHLFQPEGLIHLLGRTEMTEVDGIEGATKDSPPGRHDYSRI